jgi:hypothetical protein
MDNYLVQFWPIFRTVQVDGKPEFVIEVEENGHETVEFRHGGFIHDHHLIFGVISILLRLYTSSFLRITFYR